MTRLLRRLWGPPAIYLGASVLARVGSFVLVPLYTRRLSLAEYGDYALGQTFIMLLQTLLTAMFLTAMSRFYFDARTKAEAHERAAEVASWFALTTVISGALLQAAVILVALGARFWQQDLPGPFGAWELSCVSVSGIGAALGTVPFMSMRLEQRPLAASLFNLLQFGVTALSGICLVVVLDRGLRGALEALAVSGLASGLTALAFIASHYRFRFVRKSLRASVQFSWPLLPDSLIQFLRSATDRWILKSFGLTDDLGAYALANQVLVPAGLVGRAWNDAEGVRIGEVYRGGGVRGIWAEMRPIAGGYLLSTLAPVVLMILATPLLSLLVGKTFAPVLWMLPILGAAMVLEAMYSPPLYVVYYASKTLQISWITGATFVLSLVLNLVLIAQFGLWGAMIANLATTLSRVILMWLAARKLAADGIQYTKMP